MRKPALGVYSQVRFIPTCSAMEASQYIDILHVASFTIMLCRQQTTKVLIRLQGCVGWSVPLLFTCNKIRFYQKEGPYIKYTRHVSEELQSRNTIRADNNSHT